MQLKGRARRLAEPFSDERLTEDGSPYPFNISFRNLIRGSSSTAWFRLRGSRKKLPRGTGRTWTQEPFPSSPFFLFKVLDFFAPTGVFARLASDDFHPAPSH